MRGIEFLSVPHRLNFLLSFLTEMAKKQISKIPRPVRYDHSIFRLNISYITGYGTFTPPAAKTQRALDICPQLDALKAKVLDTLLAHQNQRPSKPTHWSIAWQTHPGTGLPHLDILIVYQQNIQPILSSFDYLIKQCQIAQIEASQTFTPGHVWVKPYSTTKFSKAIVEYGLKEDPAVISNISSDSKHQLIRVHQLKKDPYRYLELQMRKDPLRFNVQQYVQKNDLARYIASWSSIKTKLKDMQVAAANLSLKQKSGFRYIDRALIEAQLTPEELKLYDSWSGYQTIVNHLNQMILQKGNRDPKTLNLLITGAPNTGKSALVWHPNPHDHFNPISAYCSVYPIGMSQWFPKYASGIYHCIYWNQAKLTSYSYDTILKLLDGSPLDLPNKGSVSRKVDNPLIIMTSNMTLQQMIQQKFDYNKEYCEMARKNLAVRVQNVVVPPSYDLFLLQKLLWNYSG